MKTYSKEQQKLYVAIVKLKIRQKEDFNQLKIEIDEVKKSLKPTRIITQAVKNIYSDKKAKSGTIGRIISLVTGLVSHKIIAGNSSSTTRNLLSYAAQYLVSKLLVNKIKK